MEYGIGERILEVSTGRRGRLVDTPYYEEDDFPPDCWAVRFDDGTWTHVFEDDMAPDEEYMFFFWLKEREGSCGRGGFVCSSACLATWVSGSGKHWHIERIELVDPIKLEIGRVRCEVCDRMMRTP